MTILVIRAVAGAGLAETPDLVLRRPIRSALDDPAMRAGLLQHGNLPMLDPQQFAAKIKAETEVNAKVIRQANITVE